MNKLILVLSFILTSLTPKETIHIATWYNTSGHNKIHRNYSTAAYNHLPLHTKIIVTNLSNNKSDTVEITDRMSNKSSNRIDLSKTSFSKLANHKLGSIKVKIKRLI